MSLHTYTYFTPAQAQAASECVERCIPFALYAMPDSAECRFMAAPQATGGEARAPIASGLDEDCFFISRYMADEPYTAGIAAGTDEHALLDYLAAHPECRGTGCAELPREASTHRLSYNSAFKEMHRRVAKLNGKVVLSRIKAVTAQADPVGVASAYFRAAPNTFRYLCFTPEDGLWLGATPELLLRHDAGSDTYTSMALAGTRPAGARGAWDSKNIDEHDMVKIFITYAMEKLGLKVKASKTCNFNTGDVKHLCTPIRGTSAQADYWKLLDLLSPTPAVCGWPRPLAIAEIDIYETQPRRCYSGYVGIRQGGDLHTFVNLRCAFAAKAPRPQSIGNDTPAPGSTQQYIYNLYAGGGIMPASTDRDEWLETERKMAPLLQCIQSQEAL